MNSPSEIELKLEFDPGHVRKLKNSAPLRGAAETDRLVSRYFDTPDLDLHEAGYTLRVRKTKNGHVQTAKQELAGTAGLFVRPEWERPIKGRKPTIKRGDGPLPELVGDRDLAPIFQTDVRRWVRHLSLAGAQIEVAVDQGTISAGSTRQQLCEIELELKKGAPEPVFALARELDAYVPLRLGVRSKSERGYALAEGGAPASCKADPVNLDRAGGARDAFATIAAACIRHFRLNEPILLQSGGAEALHQGRIALRRLRSAFSSFRPVLAGDDTADRLRGELRWLASELGTVRDLDVLIPKMDGEDRERLITVRAEAFANVRTALESDRARMMMIDLAEWLAIGPWRVRPSEPLRGESIIPFAGKLLDKHWRRISRRGRHLAALDDPARHEVRIEAKKLRYAVEFFASLWPDKKAQKRHRAFLKGLAALQDHLGTLNDQATRPQLLAQHGIETPDLPGKERRTALRKAERAFDRLMDEKRFWR